MLFYQYKQKYNDDKGLDVVGDKRQTVKYLYDKYNELLLDCDKGRMKSIFTEGFMNRKWIKVKTLNLKK